MRKINSPKTTLIGIFMLSTILIGFVFVWFGKATLSEIGYYISPLFSVLSSIGFIAAKDDHE